MWDMDAWTLLLFEPHAGPNQERQGRVFMKIKVHSHCQCSHLTPRLTETFTSLSSQDTYSITTTFPTYLSVDVSSVMNRVSHTLTLDINRNIVHLRVPRRKNVSMYTRPHVRVRVSLPCGYSRGVQNGHIHISMEELTRTYL